MENKDRKILDELAEKHFSHSKDLYLLQLKTRRTAFSTPVI
jgi:hypothetical protein